MPDAPGSPWRELARLRVPLGFVLGVIVLWLARPTPVSLAMGVPVALAGEALRVWAAGHLEKGREVTTSGPYRRLRHPLYLGSAIMGIGLALAAARPIVALIIGLYLTLALTAAVRVEEAWLRRRFQQEYAAYAAGRVSDEARRFSLSRALVTNREHRAVMGLCALAAVLVAKAFWSR